MLDSLGGRKVVVIAGCVLLGVGLVFLKGDVPSNFLTLIQWAAGLFIAGNAVEHAAGAYQVVNASPDAAAAPAVDHTEDLASLSAKIDRLAQTDATLAQGVGVVQQTLAGIMNHYNIPQ